jgi:hypothetical protein
MRILALSALLLAGCGPAASSGRTVTVESSVPVSTRVSTQGGEFDISTNTEIRVSSQVVGLPLEAAWGALPAVYRELGIRGEVLDTDRRLFGIRSQTESGRLAGVRMSTYFDCGSGAGGLPIANTYRLEFAAVSHVRAVGDRSEVSTTVSAEGTSQTVSGPSTRCRTTGELEKRIAELMAQRAAGGSGGR